MRTSRRRDARVTLRSTRRELTGDFVSRDRLRRFTMAGNPPNPPGGHQGFNLNEYWARYQAEMASAAAAGTGPRPTAAQLQQQQQISAQMQHAHAQARAQQIAQVRGMTRQDTNLALINKLNHLDIPY